MSYLVLKHLHLSCVILTFVSFSLRGFWMLTDSALLQHKLSRILPHVIDTLLLASAIGLTISIQQFPFQDSWLTAKLAALIVYIFLGTLALKRGKTKAIRAFFLVLSLLVFAYIVWVARTHHPLPWLTI